MSPLTGSPTGPIWREMPVSRALLYITFWVHSKGAPPPPPDSIRKMKVPGSSETAIIFQQTTCHQISKTAIFTLCRHCKNNRFHASYEAIAVSSEHNSKPVARLCTLKLMVHAVHYSAINSKCYCRSMTKFFCQLLCRCSFTAARAGEKIRRAFQKCYFFILVSKNCIILGVASPECRECL